MADHPGLLGKNMSFSRGQETPAKTFTSEQTTLSSSRVVMFSFLHADNVSHQPEPQLEFKGPNC